MIIGIGTDLVKLERFRTRIECASFLTRVFTHDELLEAKSYRDPAPELATRFACKEAVMKCMGAGIRQGVWFSQICVTSRGGTRLHVNLARRARDVASYFGPCKWQVTSSSRGDFLFAQAILIADRAHTRG